MPEHVQTQIINPRCCSHGCAHPPYTGWGLLQLLLGMSRRELDKFVVLDGDEQTPEWDGKITQRETDFVLGSRF